MTPPEPISASSGCAKTTMARSGIAVTISSFLTDSSIGMKRSVFTRICTNPCVDAGAEMIGGIGSESDSSPDVTRHHRQEGADARGNRITHSAPARLWDLWLGN